MTRRNTYRLSHSVVDGAELAAELVRSVVPAGFTAGFGWWALDRLSGGAVTGPLSPGGRNSNGARVLVDYQNAGSMGPQA